MVDAIAGGSLMRRTPEDAYGLLDDMALNAFSWNTNRTARKPSGIHSINKHTSCIGCTSGSFTKIIKSDECSTTTIVEL